MIEKKIVKKEIILFAGTCFGIALAFYALVAFQKTSDIQDNLSVLGVVIAGICFILIPFLVGVKE